MAQSFNYDIYEEIKSKVNIVDVIGSVVPLKKAGANYKGNCPFHNEKTPSFVVSEQKQIFTCFGCGESGDVIGFVKRYYNLETREALEKLARENGIEIKLSPKDTRREKYYEINRQAARFFYRAFADGNNKGYQYMKNRGIDAETLRKFGIGYADEKWDSLYKYFNEMGVDDKILEELGLISIKDGKKYDKFRNRVIFPILNTAGKVIGFGGRAIDDEAMPKYLNSPENRIFQKKDNLYGLNLTKGDISKEGYGILVEGYMDVISLYQNGVKNVGASLGTALTENQAMVLKRYTKNIVLSYDSDQAGRKAAMRGLDILSSKGLKPKVLHVTDGKDPDEFIKKNGKKAYIDLIKTAKNPVEYKLSTIESQYNLNVEEEKTDFLEKAIEILKELPPVEREIYAKKVSEDYNISEGTIKMAMFDNNNSEVNKKLNVKTKEEITKQPLSLLEATVFKAIVINPTLTEELLENQMLFESDLGKKILQNCFNQYAEKNDISYTAIIDQLTAEEGEIFQGAYDKIEIEGSEEETFYQCIMKWRISILEKKRDIINRKLKSDILDESNDLIMELMNVNKELEDAREIFNGNRRKEK